MTIARAFVAAIVAVAALTSCGGGNDGPPPRVKVPARAQSDFVGIVAEDVLAGDLPEQGRVLDDLRAARVGLVRQPFRWKEVEVAPGRYDLSRLDAFVAAAAERRIRLLPILFDPPSFRSSAPRGEAARGTYPPRDPGDMGRFAAMLVRRYGPDGSLWRRRPGVPKLAIRSWQVWNEPNLPAYWPEGPDPEDYVRLLRATAEGIREADPGAEIVSAGLSETRLGMPFRDFVTGMFEAGAESAFDTFGLHAFARAAPGSLEAVRSTRRLLGKLGAGKPIWVTEYGWASSGPRSPFTFTETGQAARVEDALASFIRERRRLGIRGTVYFNWRDSQRYAGGPDFFGLYTGLLRRDGRPKPALAAFERAATLR